MQVARADRGGRAEGRTEKREVQEELGRDEGHGRREDRGARLAENIVTTQLTKIVEDVPKVVPKSELEVPMTERVALNDRKLQDLSKSEIRVKSELEVPMTERVAQNDGELQGLCKHLAPTAS